MLLRAVVRAHVMHEVKVKVAKLSGLTLSAYLRLTQATLANLTPPNFDDYWWRRGLSRAEASRQKVRASQEMLCLHR